MCQCCTEKKDIYLPQLATVVKAEAMNVTERYLRLSMDDGQFDFIPGQFVEVSVAGREPRSGFADPSATGCIR